MKKTIKNFATLGFMSLAIAAQAQWTEDVNSVYLTNGTKNVGIGTTAPAFVIDAQRSGNASANFKSATGTANLIIDRGNSSATSSVSYRTAGAPTWQTGTIGTDNFAIRNILLGSAALSINNSNNFVGVGTTAPTERLHVVGNSKVTGNFSVTNNSSFGASMNVNGNVTSTGTISGVTITSSGALDGATLNVSGRSILGDTILFGSAEGFIDGGGSTIGSLSSIIPAAAFPVNLGTTLQRWAALFANVGNFSSTLSVGSNATVGGTLDVTGSATVGSTLGVTGKTTMSGGAVVSGTVGLTVSNGINVLSGNISSGGDLYTSSGNGVINCGGDSMSSTINIMADGFIIGDNLNANGDEDLFIGGDLEVVGKGYQTGGGAWGVRSDKRLKKDINDFTDGLDKLMQIHPVTFKYNDLMPNHTEQEYVGIIAQEMQEIAPYMVEEKPMGQIVREDENGKEVIVKQGTNYLSYDPNALWYITVNAIKDQQAIIEKQADRIAALEAKLANNTADKKATVTTAVASQLEQNQPNPFNQSTVINYQLNAGDNNAQIIIRDLNGNMVKQIILNQTGKGQVTINANELAQGTYTYTLVVNGSSLDTKLMVLVK